MAVKKDNGSKVKNAIVSIIFIGTSFFLFENMKQLNSNANSNSELAANDQSSKKSIADNSSNKKDKKNTSKDKKDKKDDNKKDDNLDKLLKNTVNDVAKGATDSAAIAKAADNATNGNADLLNQVANDTSDKKDDKKANLDSLANNVIKDKLPNTPTQKDSDISSSVAPAEPVVPTPPSSSVPSSGNVTPSSGGSVSPSSGGSVSPSSGGSVSPSHGGSEVPSSGGSSIPSSGGSVSPSHGGSEIPSSDSSSASSSSTSSGADSSGTSSSGGSVSPSHGGSSVPSSDSSSASSSSTSSGTDSSGTSSSGGSDTPVSGDDTIYYPKDTDTFYNNITTPDDIVKQGGTLPENDLYHVDIQYKDGNGNVIANRNTFTTDGKPDVANELALFGHDANAADKMKTQAAAWTVADPAMIKGQQIDDNQPGTVTYDATTNTFIYTVTVTGNADPSSSDTSSAAYSNASSDNNSGQSDNNSSQSSSAVSDNTSAAPSNNGDDSQQVNNNQQNNVINLPVSDAPSTIIN